MRLGNGQWETAKFNNRLQVEELGLGHSATNAGTWKVNYEFGEYDPNSQTVTGSKNTGNIARQTVSFDGLPNAFVQTYQYDSLYRLTDANEMAGSSENWSEKFTYDRYGNRDKKFRNGLEITNNALSHPSIDPNTNRFTTTGYGYDKVGNLVTDAEGRNFTFDGNNKQRIVYDGNQTVGEYFYDGDGMRVKKKVYSNGTHTKTVVFVYSGGKLIEEYSTEAPPTDKKIKYLTKDHLGTPRIITDGNGAVVSRRDFMPFGEEIANNLGTRSTSSFKYSANEDDVRQKFTGYQQDSETNLDFAEARMYENRHARFTAVDPLLASGKSSNPQSFNRYVYVTNSPLQFNDPTGLIGDYFDRKTGEHLGHDKHKNDGKVYFADLVQRGNNTNTIANWKQVKNPAMIRTLRANINNSNNSGGGQTQNRIMDNFVNGQMAMLQFPPKPDSFPSFPNPVPDWVRQTGVAFEYTEDAIRSTLYGVSPDYFKVSASIPFLLSGEFSMSKEFRFYRGYSFDLIDSASAATSMLSNGDIKFHDFSKLNFKLSAQASFGYFTNGVDNPDALHRVMQGQNISATLPLGYFNVGVNKAITDLETNFFAMPTAVEIGTPTGIGVNGGSSSEVFTGTSDFLRHQFKENHRFFTYEPLN